MSLADQLEEAARDVKKISVTEGGEPSDIRSADDVFAELKEVCPELFALLLEQNRLGDLTRLVEFVRETINNNVMAAHWLKLGDEKLHKSELESDELKDLIRRVGMNLDSEHMRDFEGKPGELIECKLPPRVAHELYRHAFPLIVSQGLKELKGESGSGITPPENLDHDRFFGRVEAHKPGDVLVVQPDGSLKKKEPAQRRSSAEVIRRMDIAVRQEVLRQGHQVESLNLHLNADGRTIGVDLNVVDKNKPFDNKAMRDVIDREISSWNTDPGMSPRDKLQMLQDLSASGQISKEALMKEAGLDSPDIADAMGKAMASSYTQEMDKLALQERQALDHQQKQMKKEESARALEAAKRLVFPQGFKY